uniref:Ubiquitin carboxyl-terminal hydrolase n=1 Tax=Mus musculus TaxID=10090 RepID=Q8BWQ9_MOUSE|nr:unnamed protein product [Mus musculus]
MEGQRWLPLEANPEVTNQFLKQLGLHPNWQFVDVYGMEPELLSMVPRPVCAVLLLFPITEKYEVFRTEEEEKIKSQGQDVTSSVYFMKQTISNACGTIGLIHAIANNKDKMHFESGSTLKKFLEESVSMSPEERAKFLENYDVSTLPSIQPHPRAVLQDCRLCSAVCLEAIVWGSIIVLSVRKGFGFTEGAVPQISVMLVYKLNPGPSDPV